MQCNEEVMRTNHIIKILFTIFCLSSNIVYAQEQSLMAKSDFEAVTVSHTGSFELDMSPDKALPLFTGPGEVLWVPNWNPILFSGNGLDKGSVFQTENHLNKTTWLVLDYDIHTKYASYLRMTPEYDVGTVNVSLKANKSGGTIVSVTYNLTGLGVERNNELANWNSQAYAQEMKEWRSLIIAAKDKINAHYSE